MATSAINIVHYLEDTRTKLANGTLPDVNRAALQLIREMLERSLVDGQEAEQVAKAHQ